MSKLSVQPFMWQFVALLMFLPFAANADDRLLGSWKSDREESMRFNRAHTLLEPKQTAFLDQILGHLEITFEATKVRSRMPDLTLTTNGKTSTFHGMDDTFDYRVLGADKDSVAVFVEKYGGATECSTSISWITTCCGSTPRTRTTA